MKKPYLLTATLCTVAAISAHAQTTEAPTNNIRVTQYAKTTPTKGSPDYFTGDVTVESYFKSPEQDTFSGAMVRFSPTSRTAWHTHPRGQMLIVTEGTGYVQKEGEAAQKITTGDVVWIPKHVKHWHGAGTTTAMSHIAILSPKEGDVVTWMEHVTDTDYTTAQE